MINTPRSASQGFTIMELLLSVAILAILMLAVTEVFSKSFGSYRQTKEIEKAITDAQFAANLFSKELRTSTIINQGGNASSSKVKFFEYSKSECIQYRFANATIEVARSASGSDFSDCNTTSDLSNFTTALGASNVTGFFEYIRSDAGVPQVGRVNMTVSIPTSGTPVVLQSVTSLRDYGNVGIQ